MTKGFFAPMPEPQIPSDAGGFAWGLGAFDLIDEQDDFNNIHPSLM